MGKTTHSRRPAEGVGGSLCAHGHSRCFLPPFPLLSLFFNLFITLLYCKYRYIDYMVLCHRGGSEEDLLEALSGEQALVGSDAAHAGGPSSGVRERREPRKVRCRGRGAGGRGPHGQGTPARRALARRADVLRAPWGCGRGACAVSRGIPAGPAAPPGGRLPLRPALAAPRGSAPQSWAPAVRRLRGADASKGAKTTGCWGSGSRSVKWRDNYSA